VQLDQRGGFDEVVLALLGRDVGFDEPEVLLDGLIHHLLSDNVVEEHVELDDDAFEGATLIGCFLGHKETVLFFEDMLYFTNNMRSPNNLPVFVGIVGLFLYSLFEGFQGEDIGSLSDVTEEVVFLDDLSAFLEDLFLAFQLFWAT
jgi:hypothetical protein